MSELVKRAKAALVKALPFDDACHVDEAHGVVDGWVDFEAATIAVIREVLAEMRKPSVAMGREGLHAMRAGSLVPSPREIRVAMLDAFAREHGLADE